MSKENSDYKVSNPTGTMRLKSIKLPVYVGAYKIGDNFSVNFIKNLINFIDSLPEFF